MIKFLTIIMGHLNFKTNDFGNAPPPTKKFKKNQKQQILRMCLMCQVSFGLPYYFLITSIYLTSNFFVKVLSVYIRLYISYIIKNVIFSHLQVV